MANATETEIKIKLNAAGDDVEFELVGEEAKNGNRLDQVVARLILELNKNIHDPRFMQAYQQNQQQTRWNNPQARPMAPMGGGFPPFPAGNNGGMNWGNNSGMNYPY